MDSVTCTADAHLTSQHGTLELGFGDSAPFPQTVSGSRMKEGHRVGF